MATHVIHVLLVEHDRTDLNTIKDTLESLSYKVTAVEQASDALSLLSEENFHYDVLMANVNILESCTLYLLQATTHMDFLMILLCDDNDDDHSITIRALELGAYLCIKKPVAREKFENLWQHVVRKKVRGAKDKDLCRNFPEYSNATQVDLGNEFMEKFSNNDNGNGFINDGETKDTWDSKALQQDDDNNAMFKRKVWTEWTPELHQKFMNAAAQLGEGRCYPKDILELMNVPGLTRMQVASHLQKCRSANWIPPSQRKNKQAYIKMLTPRRTKAPRSKTVKFGSMPQVNNNNSPFHDQQAPIAQQRQARDSGENNQDESYYYNFSHNPQFASDDLGTNYSIPQSSETLTMAQQGYTFGIAEPFVYGVQNGNTTNANFTTSYQIPEASDFPYVDGGASQNFLLMQHELGMGYDGGFQAVFPDQVYCNQQMNTLFNNASTYPWNHGSSVHNE